MKSDAAASEGEEMNFGGVFSSTAIENGENARDRADLEETPIERDFQNSTLVDAVEDLGLTNASGGPTVFRIPPGFTLDFDEELRKEQSKQAGVIAKLELIGAEQKRLTREADRLVNEEPPVDEEVAAGPSGPAVANLKLELKLKATTRLTEVKEMRIQQLNREKEILRKKNKELKARLNVETRDIGVGPNVEMPSGIKEIPWKRPEHYEKKGSVEEGRWTVDARDIGIQLEMGENSTLRNREKVTGENKLRPLHVRGDWKGRMAPWVLWDEMETRSQKAWRRRLARIAKEQAADLAAEWELALKNMREFEEAGGIPVVTEEESSAVKPGGEGAEEEQRMEVETTPANPPDRPEAPTKRLSRSQRRKAKKAAMKEDIGQSPKLRRTEVAQKIRKEMQKAAKEGDEQIHIPSPERPSKEKNSTREATMQGTTTTNMDNEEEKKRGFDARQKLTPRDPSDPVDDTELQMKWILQESSKEERTFRIEEEIKKEKRKQRDRKREEKRKQNDEYDRKMRQEMREAKMKDDKKARDANKADMQQYMNFQRIHYEQDKIDKEENIIVTSSTGNYVFFQRPRERLTHEYKKLGSTRREEVRKGQRDRKERKEGFASTLDATMKEAEALEAQSAKAAEDQDESMEQEVDDEDRAPKRRAKK